MSVRGWLDTLGMRRAQRRARGMTDDDWMRLGREALGMKPLGKRHRKRRHKRTRTSR